MRRAAAGILLTALLLPAPASAAENPRDWQQAAEGTMARLWSAMEPPPGVAGKPQVRVLDDAAVNAFVRRVEQASSSGERFSAEVTVCRGLLDRLVMDNGKPDPAALAGVLGHELGHLALGHHLSATQEARQRARSQDEVLGASFTREDEYAADLYGMKLAGQAGYDPRGLVRAFQRGREALGDAGAWEQAEGDHPTFTQRLAVIDAEQAELWRAVLDFEVGVDMLRAGNYSCGQECFRGALAMFPEAPEVLCNLGYSLLMDYYRRLPPEYWAAHDIGRPMPVGFATFLPVPVRRSCSSEELAQLRRQWQEAVGYLDQARQKQPGYGLALGNLGFAYLIAPDGPQADQAQECLTGVAASPPDSGDDVQRSVGNNLALVAMLQGRREEALSLLQANAGPQGRAASLLSDAPVMNLCLLAADSPVAEDQERAVQELEGLLERCPATTAEWQYAHAKYLATCRKLGRTPLSEEKLSPPNPAHVESCLQWKGVSIYLEDSAARLWRLLGKPDVSIALGAGTGEGQPAITCWRYGACGLELTFLRSTLVRARVTRARGQSGCQAIIPLPGMKGTLSVGDPVQRLDDLLGFCYDGAVRLGESRPYRLYSAAHLAVRVDQGLIAALAVVGVRG